MNYDTLFIVVGGLGLAAFNFILAQWQKRRDDAAKRVIAEQQERIQEIHVLVNSNLTAAKDEIATLKVTVASLQETVAKLATAGRSVDEAIVTEAIKVTGPTTAIELTSPEKEEETPQ